MLKWCHNGLRIGMGLNTPCSNCLPQPQCSTIVCVCVFLCFAYYYFWCARVCLHECWPNSAAVVGSPSFGCRICRFVWCSSFIGSTCVIHAMHSFWWCLVALAVWISHCSGSLHTWSTRHLRRPQGIISPYMDGAKLQTKWLILCPVITLAAVPRQQAGA